MTGFEWVVIIVSAVAIGTTWTAINTSITKGALDRWEKKRRQDTDEHKPVEKPE